MRPRPLLGDKAGLEVQVLRGRFAAFCLDLSLFGREKAAGGSRGERSRGAVGHTRYFHLGFHIIYFFSPVPYFREEAKRSPGLRLSSGVWVEGTDPLAALSPVRLQDPAFGLQTLWLWAEPPVIMSPLPPQSQVTAQRWQRAGEAQTSLSVTAEMDGARRSVPGWKEGAEKAKPPGKRRVSDAHRPTGTPPKRRGEGRSGADAAPAPQRTETSLKNTRATRCTLTSFCESTCPIYPPPPARPPQPTSRSTAKYPPHLPQNKPEAPGPGALLRATRSPGRKGARFPAGRDGGAALGQHRPPPLGPGPGG